jgi:hypothetical protein
MCEIEHGAQQKKEFDKRPTATKNRSVQHRFFSSALNMMARFKLGKKILNATVRLLASANGSQRPRQAAASV